MSLNELTMPQRLRQGLVAYWPLDNVSRNLVANGGFETNTTGWTSHNTGALARITTQSKFGSACLEITGDAANEGAILSSTGNAAQNTTYTASVWLKARDTDDVGKFVQWFVQSQGGTFEIFVAPILQLNADWTRYTFTFTWANASHTGWQLAVRFSGDPGGTFHILVDGVQYEQSDTATPYIETDGAAASRGGKSALWTPSSGPLDLTNNNGVTTTTGPSNNLRRAASFVSASSQYISRADMPLLELTNGGMFVTWVYLTDKLAQRGVLNKYLGTGDQREYSLNYSFTTDRFEWLTSSTGAAAGLVTAAATNLGSPSTGTWYMITCYWDKSAGKQGIKVNLLAANEAAQTTVFGGTAAFQIGSTVNTSIFMNGRVGPTGFWSRILRDDDIAWLYNDGQGRDLRFS